MADPTLDEMMNDLAAADAAGDDALARHIAGRIKAAQAPKIGMGNVQAAPSAQPAFAPQRTTANIPVAAMTGDPETDQRIADLAAAAGQTKPITKKTAADLLLLSGSLAAPEVAGPVLGGALGGGLGAYATSQGGVQGLKSAIIPTLAGAAGGYVIPKAVAAVAPAVRAAGQKLEDLAIRQGRKALSGIGTSLAARAPVPAEAIQQAIQAGAIRPFAGVHGIAERLGDIAEQQAQQYGNILQRLEAQGVHGPQAEALARDFQQRAAEAAQSSLNSPRPGMLAGTAQELEQKALPISGQGRLGLMQAEQMKRTLQDEAAREYDKIARQFSIPGQTKKEIAGVMKDAIEQAVQEQASLAPQEAAAFEPAKAQLSRTYAALRAAEEGAARASRRKPISLPSTIVGAALAGGGHEAAAIPVALLHGLVEHRLPATLASTAASGSEFLNRLAAVAPQSTGESGYMAALIAALRNRPGIALPVVYAGGEEER